MTGQKRNSITSKRKRASFVRIQIIDYQAIHVEVQVCCQSSIITNNAATENLKKVQDFVTKTQVYKFNSSFYVNS